MKPLARRIAALEGPGWSDLSHLSDEELDARIIGLLEATERAGGNLPEGWRDGDLAAAARIAIGELERLACETA